LDRVEELRLRLEHATPLRYPNRPVGISEEAPLRLSLAVSDDGRHLRGELRTLPGAAFIRRR